MHQHSARNLLRSRVVNAAFVAWLRWNVPIIVIVGAIAYACFVAFSAYLDWRDRRLKVQVKLIIGPAIVVGSGARAGRDMLIVGLRNVGLPTTITGCQFQTTTRDKKYRSSDDGMKPRALGLDERELLIYPPAFVAKALKRDGYRDVVAIRALVADSTGATFVSEPVSLDIDWALKEEAEHKKAVAKGA